MTSVLVRYKNQTRKIRLERKTFSGLIREVRDKFDLPREERFDVQVFDKPNNVYFKIEKNEMNEIRSNSMIRIVKSQNRNAANSSPKQKSGGGKKKGAQLKPPGVPAYSKADNKARNSWRKGSVVEMYSETNKTWKKGEVMDIFNDREGEWLVVKTGYRTGEIQRFSNFIRVVQPARKQKAAKKDAPKREKKAKKAEPKAPRAKKEKIVLPTTQSKYKRAPKEPLSFKDNEIHIKGNTQNVKKFVERAIGLLQGMEVTKKKKADAEANDDEKAEVEVEVETLQFDTIHLFGGNRAMGAVVSVSELVKRCVPNLHQVTALESITITDSYIPTEIGLKEVQVERPLVQLRITLSVNPKDIDVNADGYQAPENKQGAVTSIPTRRQQQGGKAARGGRRK